MGLYAVLLVFLVCYHLLFYDRVQCNWSLSREEDFDIEKQLKMLNKPALRTIVNKYGDIYDCVPFYKQPAFDHHLLKNHTFGFQDKSFLIYNKTIERESSKVELCPVGSVPIRRITKEDLVRERHASKDRDMDTTNHPRTFLAIARTKGGQAKYTGGIGFISLHNPRVFGHQFTAARIKLQSGNDSIEAGWRVDPTLYWDNRTRLYVRTDAGFSHCFNTRCPAFVLINRGVSPGYAFTSISIPGRDHYELPIRIVRDNENGNWNFVMGMNDTYVGYWPSQIFTGPVDYIEWGGAAYSPPGSPLPPMGSGNFPIGSRDYDAFVSNLEVVDEKGETRDVDYIEMYANDSSLYSVSDTGYQGTRYRRVILYGGPGGTGKN